MGHRLHRVVLRLEGLGKQQLAVARGARRQNVQPGPRLFVALPDVDEGPLGHVQRLTLVGGVEGAQQLLLVVHQHKLGGGAPRVDAQVGADLLPGLGDLPLQGVLLVPRGKGRPLLLRGEEGPGGAVSALTGPELSAAQKLQQGSGGTGLAVEHGVGGHRRAAGHHKLRAGRDEHFLLLQLQPLGKYLHQHGIEGERAAFKHHRPGDLQPLGQSADGLLGNGVEGGEGQIRLGHPLVQQRLDVGLGVDAAPARDVVDAGALCGQLVEVLHRHLEDGGNLVNEGPCAPGTAAVHAHVRHVEGPGGLVLLKEDHLGVLAAQLNGAAHHLVPALQRRRVGGHLLDKGEAKALRDGLGAGSGETKAEGLAGKGLLQLLHDLNDAADLVGVVAPVVGVEQIARVRVQNRNLGGGGSNINSGGQSLRGCLVLHGICHGFVRSFFQHCTPMRRGFPREPGRKIVPKGSDFRGNPVPEGTVFPFIQYLSMNFVEIEVKKCYY